MSPGVCPPASHAPPVAQGYWRLCFHFQPPVDDGDEASGKIPWSSGELSRHKAGLQGAGVGGVRLALERSLEIRKKTSLSVSL